MKLHIESVKSFTLIENKFIDEYMPSADGEFVKLYLYLLRCAGSGTEVSVSWMEASAISACFPRRTKKKRMLNHP